jgi:hypothetical protein
LSYFWEISGWIISYSVKLKLWNWFTYYGVEVIVDAEATTAFVEY